MPYFISIFIIVPILLVILLIGLLTMVIPALRHFYPLVSHIFLFVFLGFVAGYVLSILLPLGVMFLADLISNYISIPQGILTLIGFFALVSALLIPLLGATIGLIFSLRRRGKIPAQFIGRGSQPADSSAAPLPSK